MNTTIRVRGFTQAPWVRTMADDEIRNTIGRFHALIHSVRVFIEDVNGPDRGGLDKRVLVELRPKHGRAIIAEDVGFSVFATLRAAALRAARRLRHQPKG